MKASDKSPITLLLAFVLVACAAGAGSEAAHVHSAAAFRMPAHPGPYVYAGCRMFPGVNGGRGWFDTDVYNAPPDPNSAAYIQGYEDAIKAAPVNSGIDPGFSFYFKRNNPHGLFLNYINWATNATPVVRVIRSAGNHYVPAFAPWSRSFPTQFEAGDAHGLVIDTTRCIGYQFYLTRWNGAGITVGAGGAYDLRKPYDYTRFGAALGTESGLPHFALDVTPEDFARGYINHAMFWNSVGCEEQGGVRVSPISFVLGGVPPSNVPPIPDTTSLSSCLYSGPVNEEVTTMRYGAHIRLKRSFDDLRFPRGARIVAEGLKHYGAYLADTGCCNVIMNANDPTGAAYNLFGEADYEALHRITITDFNVVAPFAQ